MVIGLAFKLFTILANPLRDVDLRRNGHEIRRQLDIGGSDFERIRRAQAQGHVIIDGPPDELVTVIRHSIHRDHLSVTIRAATRDGSPLGQLRFHSDVVGRNVGLAIRCDRERNALRTFGPSPVASGLPPEVRHVSGSCRHGVGARVRGYSVAVLVDLQSTRPVSFDGKIVERAPLHAYLRGAVVHELGALRHGNVGEHILVFGAYALLLQSGVGAFRIGLEDDSLPPRRLKHVGFLAVDLPLDEPEFVLVGIFPADVYELVLVLLTRLRRAGIAAVERVIRRAALLVGGQSHQLVVQIRARFQ